MGRIIELGGSDIFTHLLVVGPTRSGKTATILKPMIYQLLMAKKRGVPLGISCVEPKGDVAQIVADMAKEMELPYTHIDPMQPEITGKFNPMEGEINTVAEATVIVLKGLFGKQEDFFATVQELSARNVTKLLKELNGDNMDITDVLHTLRDDNVLRQKVAELKQRDGTTDLVHFFESELLGSMAEKYRQFVLGLRAQLENIISNDALRKIMSGKSSVDIDEHFETGGILAVNTALGMLRSSGDAFGQFVIMHLQNGTFRRPGTENTRIPHFLIVDEYSRYINPDVEIFLSLAAEYRVAGIFATQSLGQLAIESGKLSGQEMKRSILASCRNKIAFGGVTYEDAADFANEFGKDKIIMRQSTYDNKIVGLNLFPASFRDTEDEEYRFDPTDIRDGLARFTYIHQLMSGGVLQKPALAEGTFVPRDWKELREWEDKSALGMIKKVKNFFTKDEKLLNKDGTVGQTDELSAEEVQRIYNEAEKEAEMLEEAEQKKNEELNLLHKDQAEVSGEEAEDSLLDTSNDSEVPKKQSANDGWLNVDDLKELASSDSLDSVENHKEAQPEVEEKLKPETKLKPNHKSKNKGKVGVGSISNKGGDAETKKENLSNPDGFWSE